MIISTSYNPSSSQLEDRFRRIEQKFSTVDRRLEDNEYYRREVGYNWGPWFYDASNDLRDATRQFQDVTRGRASSVSYDLNRAVDTLYRNGDKLREMDRRNQSFGYGWGAVLDNPIRAIRDAIYELRRYGRDW